MLKTISRAFLDANQRASALFDRLLPRALRVDGYSDFAKQFAPAWIRPGMKIVDVGGGKRPYFSPSEKNRLSLQVVGLDISADELALAPAGAYDQTLCSDISSVAGDATADACICLAVLEHVQDTQAAIQSLSTLLKPGGVALIFVPSRNACFARLNLLLPQEFKVKLLSMVFRDAHGHGFVSYYHRCTPKDFAEMASNAGLAVQDARFYFSSKYFAYFLPAHIVWRAWILLFKAICGNQAAETFAVALVKRQGGNDPRTA